MPRDRLIRSSPCAGLLLPAALVLQLLPWLACRPPQGGFGRVSLLESRLGPSSWSVLVDDQGQGADLSVDGARRQAECRRTGQGIRCWVGGLREGFHRLAIQVGGRGTTRRTGLSPAPAPGDLVIYELILDRFADGDPGNNLRVRPGDRAAPHGGDLAGLASRLPFLRELGVNAILLSPLWEHARVSRGASSLPAFTGQRPSGLASARRLSPAFGDASELMRLLSSARRRGLRVLMDFPRPEGWSLEDYFEVVRSWVSRTQADGARLGPPASGEEARWAKHTRLLADAFSPLVLIHRPGGSREGLVKALASLEVSARIIEDRSAGAALLGALGCPGAKGTSAVSLGDPSLGAPLRPGARILSDGLAPPISARCLLGKEGALARERAARRADLAFVTHLLLAEIPVIFYADGLDERDDGAAFPAVDWTVAERSSRHQLMRSVLTLRRKVPALRGSAERVRADGETLLITRGKGACMALVALHLGDEPRKLDLSLAALGWPKSVVGGAGSRETPLEFVERLTGRGLAAENGLLTLELEPRSVSVLTPARQDGCRG